MTHQFALLGNGPISNRGCEAIVVGTKIILETTFGDSDFLLGSFANDPAGQLPPNVHPLALPITRPRWSSDWVQHRLRRYLGLPEIKTDFLRYLKGYMNNIEAVLSIGGDGYAIDYGRVIVDRLMVMNDYAHNLDIPVIIWGASIGPFKDVPDFEREIVEHFKQIELIVVREPISLDYLAKLGVSQNVCMAPDPAFAVDPVPCNLPSELEVILAESCIGLNLSPLIAKYATGGDVDQWVSLGAKLVETVIQISQRPVVLIYHVTMSTNHANRLLMDDLMFLQAVLDKVAPVYRDQVQLIPDGLDCQQLKWVISRTSVFIGARTHSTIAALSCTVPCISIAYSTKAWGINEAIFGNTEWVLPSPTLSVDSLRLAVEKVLGSEAAIKAHLTKIMPGIKADATAVGHRIREFMK